MALALREHTNISEGALAAQTTKLTNDAKIAYALFTGIVKDKIGYPIREYAKNAWEVTPKGKPFLIELPTRWSPKFRIRDYGPGLSHHFMLNRYANLGDSTKDTNGVGGVSGWGFGSKSGLAYLMEDGMSGSYTVISYREGTASHYIISLASSGMPEVKHFMDVPTEEEDGLEVSFAVREEDFRAFEQSAREILWSFEPRPKVVPDLKFKTPAITAQGKNWTSFNSNTVPFHGPQVRVGPVMYPIDMSEISGSIGFVQPNDCIIFDVEADAVSPTASREQLQYTSGTKKALSAMITAYEQGFITELQAKVDKATCYFEANEIFRSGTTHLGIQRYSGMREKLSWGGQQLRSGIDAKVMHLRKGWSSFDRFSGDKHLDPGQIGKPKVVVEHGPYSSLDRFIASDLVGENILWARVKKDDLPIFLGMCALKEDDVVILDKAPIAKRASTQVGTRHDQIRRRRTVTVKPLPSAQLGPKADYTEGVSTVDLAKGGIKLTKVSLYSMRRKDGFNFGANYKVMRDSQFQDFLANLVELKIINGETQILIDTGVDELSDDWIDAGDYFSDKLNAIIDRSKLTPIQQQARSSEIDHKIKLLCGLDLNGGPQDLIDLRRDFKKALAEIEAQEARIETDNDKAFKTLMQIKDGLAFPIAPGGLSPAQAINNRGRDLLEKYPLISVIMGAYSGYGSNSKDQYYKHYFKVLANQK